MALSKKSFVRIGQMPVGETSGAAGADMVSQFAYATKDADTVVEAAGYFNGLRDDGLIKKGDCVSAVVSFAGTPERKDYVFTAVPASGNVTVVLQSAT